MNHRYAFVVIIVLELLIILAIVSWAGFTLSALQATTRYSGRLSLLVFSVIFLFHNRRPNLDETLLGKPFHAFALAHGIHLLELLAFVYLSGATLIPLRLAGGIVAYLLVFAMPVIVTLRQAKRIKENHYQLFEKIFLYYIWIVFFLTYLPRVRGTLPNVGGSYWEHVVLLGWVSAMLGTKIIGLIKFKPRTSL